MKNYLRICVALSLCVALNISAEAAPQSGQMQNGQMQGGKMNGGPMNHRCGGDRRGMNRMAQELNLTDAQIAKIRAIREAQRPQMQAIFNNKSLTPAQKRTRMMAIMNVGLAKMRAILTPAQRKKVAAMRQQQMAHMKSRNAAR